MAVSQVNNQYGEAAILHGQPDVVGNLDCVYRPFTLGLFLSEDPSWGIYNLDGTLISAAAYARGSEQALIGQSMWVPPETGPIAHIDEEHIYFGPLIADYGHFIVTSLARTWYINKITEKNTKLLCHSDHDVAAHFRRYMGRMIDGLELHLAADHHQSRLRRLAAGVRRRQNNDGHARPADPPVRYRRDWQYELAVQKPLLSLPRPAAPPLASEGAKIFSCAGGVAPPVGYAFPPARHRRRILITRPHRSNQPIPHAARGSELDAILGSQLHAI